MNDFDFLNETNFDKPENKKPYRKFNKNTKKKNTNVRGENKINLWNKDIVEPLEINSDDFKTDRKYATLTIANKSYELTETEKERLKTILKNLKEQGYRLRFICNYIKPVYNIVTDIFEDKDLIMITPWKTYCKQEPNADKTLYLPSDMNIRAAAHYFKNYHNFHTVLKLLKASVITTLYGWYNNEPSEYTIVIDPYYKGKKIDFEKSKDTTDLFLLGKHLSINLFNLSIEKDFEDLNGLTGK